MQWERRRPLWPRVTALGLLLALALLAPRSWQTIDTETSVDSSSVVSTQPAEISAEPQLPIHVLSHPPICLDGPSPEPALAPPEATIPPSPSLSELPTFNLEALVQVRDQLLALVDQLPTDHPTTSNLPTPSAPSYAATTQPKPRLDAPTVRVGSEADRLAMLPRLSISAADPPTSVKRKHVAEPVFIAPEEQPEGADNSPVADEPRQPRSLPSPRLTMVPSQPELSAPSPPEEAQPVPVLQETSPPAEPPPLRHRPLALITRLENFSPGSPGALWAQEVLTALRQLTDEGIPDRPSAEDTLAELERLYAASLEQAGSDAYVNHWKQTTQSLGRRLVLWRVLLNPQQPRVIESSPATIALRPILEAVLARLTEADSGEDWRSHLMLDRALELTSEGIDSPVLARAKLAQEILARMTNQRLSDAQVEFLSSAELVQLREALRPWAAGKVNLETLAALVERYEAGRQNRYAEAVAQLQQRLKWSDDPATRELATLLDQHYRGANMRIAMSDVLMNRMLPAQKPIVSPVRERIAGAKVRGRARTTTELRVRLQPDPQAWHVTLEANGKVYSHTRSDTWPARIRNAAKMQYQGHKDVSVSSQGVKMSPARATARGGNELVGVDSQLDPIPLVGHLLRDMARQKHRKSRPTANSQTKAKVVRQVKERMDTGLEEKLEVFEQKFRDKVLAPIEELALLAEPLEMHTTEKRAVMQLRLANHDQLAAHTLRPYAPSDSVLSVQMHETALNNAMMGLGLDGQKMTLLELFEFLTARFGSTKATPPEDMPKRATIQFAKRDAARVKCDGDQLEVILSVAELAHRRDKIRNFEIHAHFRAVLNGLSVRLVHDGSLQFSGRRLKTGPRVVLHSVLGKVLPENQAYTLVSPKVMLDPRFKGLMVTQLVLEDGWLGMAIGPVHSRRVAVRAPRPDVLPTPFVR